MLVRHVVLLILSLGLLSGCASVAPTADPEPPSQPPPVQEKASPRQQSDLVTESTTESEDEKEVEKEVEKEAGSRSNENSTPEVSVEEAAPEDNMPKELSLIAEVEPAVNIEIQPEVPQASLPDKLPGSRRKRQPKSRPDIQSSGVTPQVKFLLLSPQIDVRATEGETVQGEPAEPKKPGEPRKEPPLASSASDSETTDMTDAQGTSDAQVSEKPDNISKPPPPKEKDEQKAELIRAEPGEHVHLTLPGLGWIYDRGASRAQGVEFQSRNYKDNSTEFVFIAQSIGSYTLSFQQQDNRLGSSTFRTVAVDVGPHTATGKEKEPIAAAEPSGMESGGKMEAEETEFSFARLEESITSQNISDTAEQLQTLLHEQASHELFTSGNAVQEQLVLLVEAGDLLFDAQQESAAEQALRLYLELTEERGEHTGRVLFLLGQIYESPLPPRDERQSAEYYRKIVSFYPTDPYRQRAEQRIKYLQRHFFRANAYAT